VRKAAPAPIVAMAAMILIWGYSWVVMKIALRHAHPFDFAAVRVAIGCALLFALVKMRGRSLRLPGYRLAFLLGMLQVALFVGLSHFALLYAGPGKTSVLVFTMPFWIIVFAHFILHERMRGAQWIAVALGFIGLLLIIEPWKLTNVTGSLLAVAAGAVWGFSAVLSKKWPTASASDPLLFTAWQLFFGFFVLALLALVHPHGPIDWNREFVWTLLFSAIFASAIGWWLWAYVLANSPAGVTGLNSLGIPVVAVIGSAIQLGERPPATELAGMLLIGIALALLAWLGMRRPSVPTAAANPVD
jgi:drug/metabolite transporter (DMT)-like permease